MRIHPGGFRVVLAGAKVSRLLPFLQAKGFNAEAFVTGNETMSRLRAAPCHLLLFELECGDMMGVDLARAAKIDRLAGATLLVDDPMKSGMIVAALSRGVDSYVALPPDETVFFDRVEGLLLQQWGLVVTQQQQALTDELNATKQQLAAAQSQASSASTAGEQKLREQLKAHEATSSRQIKELEAKLARAASSSDTALKDMTERQAMSQRRVVELTRELGMLRDQLATMHLVAGTKGVTSDEGPALRGFDDDVNTLNDNHRSPKKAATTTVATAKAVPATKTRPGPVSGVGDHLGDIGDATDNYRLADLPDTGRPPSDFDEATQAIPASLALSLVEDAARKDGVLGRPARAVTPPGSVNELSDFLPPTGSFAGPGNDAHTRAIASPLDLDLGGGALLDDLQQLSTAASFGEASDFDARTMAVPKEVLGAMIAAKKPPPDDFFFDEHTPAKGAPSIPPQVSFTGNDDATAPRGIDTRTPPPARGRPASLDSQIVKDVSRLPSIGDEEIIFLEDD
ncbi:MAG TPA: hypothetical protein VGF99_20570 [Myxococcota bacterium]